jgi:asparagine synthase (glutamine-hydrolysing)
MCGIAGILTLPGREAANALDARAAAMAARLAHRGPDATGTWADAAAGIAFGHTRLAIIDTSDFGRQPMLSHCGRYVICYNGEVYNFRELRRELEPAGIPFSGHSDTEVVLAAIAHLGVIEALERFHGMFALAIWDRAERVLHLARDRIGQKPLYYGWNNGEFLFMSELKALRAAGAEPAIDRDALPLYLRHGYVPGPMTIYRDFFKLPAGAVLSLKSDRLQVGTGGARVETWWSATDAARRGRAATIARPEEAADELHATLKEVVRERLVADVPLGLFLSGGIDSSTVAALMQAQAPNAVKTFSIGFRDDTYDEARYARRVAAHLGTEHTEVTLDANDAMDAVTRMGEVYDEPFADSSQVPTYLLCKLTRRHVTVALSGDGGDELFFGYRRYLRMCRAAAAWRRTPRFVRTMLARRLAGAAAAAPESRTAQRVADLAAPSELALYRNRLSKWQHPEVVLLDGTPPASRLDADIAAFAALPLEEAMMLIDQRGSLCDDMLVKVDRASMAVGLEARSPLLDHRVVELAWRMPVDFKLRGGRTKWPLRAVLERYVPRELVDRRKMGFGAPVGAWLRAPALRDWCEDLLAPARLDGEGFFNGPLLRSMWSQLLRGEGHWHVHFWYVLMFQAWYAAQHPG